ncbi:MAG TPA: MetQ/NlpA family ABC transporter substrate-binding protein [Syntrophomonadaceae bacterium]|nr:MetQ/NlpA family ABC transporter substrate-binding protein [Syntrophomonadaceae bacterium]
MKKYVSLLLIASLLLAAGLLAGCSKQSPTQPGQTTTASTKLKVGAIGEPHSAMLNLVKPKLAQEGVDLEIVSFTDYSQLNPALKEKQIDANFFQHIPYLEDYNKKTGSDLVWTVKIHTEPMRIYSKKIDKLDKLADKATVGIPNDPSNSGRALMVLQSAGLIKLKADAGVTATDKDIIENKKNLKITMADAAALPRLLDDADICVINTNYALDAGLDPMKALFVEPGDSPFANVIVVRADSKNDPRIEKLGKALQSPEIAQFLKEKYPAVVLAF